MVGKTKEKPDQLKRKFHFIFFKALLNSLHYTELPILPNSVCANSYCSQLLLPLSHFSHALLFVTLWTVACQAPLSIGFSRQEYWSCHALLQGLFPIQGSSLCLLHWQEFFTTSSSLPLAPPGKHVHFKHVHCCCCCCC